MRAEFWNALQMAEGQILTPESIKKVTRVFGEEAGRWAFAQLELRKRAGAKFRDAEKMAFDRESYEMATHEAVAAYHASRFPKQVVVADLTCGLGGDLRALARRGPAFGIDIDGDRLKLAEWNTRGLPVELMNGDCLAAPWKFDYAFADPSRRTLGRRTLDPREFSPDPAFLAEKMRSLALGGLKLSPLLPDVFLESLGPGLEFVSHKGECKEALVWCGRLAEGGRWAVQAESGARLAASSQPKSVATALEFLYDADPSVIRAHALGAFGLSALGDSNGYLTGPTSLESSWLRRYRVLASGPGDLKRTKAVLRGLDAATPEIKVRGAKVDTDRLATELKGSGKRVVSLVIWPIGKSLRHTIVVRD